MLMKKFRLIYFVTLFGNDVHVIEHIGFLNLCDINYIKPLMCKIKRAQIMYKQEYIYLCTPCYFW